MAVTPAQTAQRELDKAVADVERKRKLRTTCVERVKQAQTAALAAGAELDEAVGIADWLAQHPLLKDAAPEPESDGKGTPGPEPVAETADPTPDQEIQINFGADGAAPTEALTGEEFLDALDEEPVDLFA